MIRLQNRRGLTLLELLVVLTILASLATLVVPMIGQFGSQSQAGSTWESMLRLQDLIVNHYMADMHDASGNGELPRPGYAGLNGTGVNGSTTTARSNHPQLRYLFINPGPLDTDDGRLGRNTLSVGECHPAQPAALEWSIRDAPGGAVPRTRDPTVAATAGFGAEFGVADVDGVDQTTGATALRRPATRPCWTPGAIRS